MAVEARLQMEKAIGDGLQQGWFELHFQPQYDLRTRRLTGFEALVRMNHPELGEVLARRVRADRRRERAHPAARRVDHPRRVHDRRRMAAAPDAVDQRLARPVPAWRRGERHHQRGDQGRARLLAAAYRAVGGGASRAVGGHQRAASPAEEPRRHNRARRFRRRQFAAQPPRALDARCREARPHAGGARRRGARRRRAWCAA